MTRGPRLDSSSISGTSRTLGRAVDADALVAPQHVRVRVLTPRVLGFPGSQPCLVWTSLRLRARDWRPRAGEHHSRAARGHGAARLVPPSRGMLDRFIALHDAPPEQVRDFAREFGALGICRHGKPCAHAPRTCTPLGWNGRTGFEPVAAWTHYAARARAIVNVAASLRHGAVPSATALSRLREPPAILTSPRPGLDVVMPRSVSATYDRRTMSDILSDESGADAWAMVVAAVNLWLADGDARPQVVLHETRGGPEPRVRFGTPWSFGAPSWPLFGALGLQLALAIGETSVAICDGCGKHYRPKRMPSVGRSHYCSTCGPRVAARIRQRRRRAAARV